MSDSEMVVLADLLSKECKSRHACDDCPLFIEDELSRLCVISTGFPEDWALKRLPKSRQLE